MQEFTRKNVRIWSMLGMRRIVGQVLIDMVELDNNFLFMTADVARYFGTENFQKLYPNRIIDAGIAEQNMIGVAAGMVKEGVDVFAATYATFITARALDQVRVNMGYMKLGLKLIGVGGGLAEGDLSATHMGLEDISNMRVIPNITVISPADGMETVKAMYALASYKEPAYLRLSGKTNLPIIYKEDFDFKIGKANVLKEGKDIALIGTGTMVSTCLKTAKGLEKFGYSCTVIDMHTIKPLDCKLLDQIIEHKLIVSIEEHMICGGMGSAIAEYLASRKNKPPQLIFGIPNNYPDASEYEILLKKCELVPEEITEKINNFIKNKI